MADETKPPPARMVKGSVTPPIHPNETDNKTPTKGKGPSTIQKTPNQKKS